MTDPDRTVNHCALHNSVGCSRVPGNNPIETPATEESFDRSRHRESRWQGTGLGKRAVRVAGYRCDSHRNRQGRTLGRDELQATGVDRTGFKIETESVGLERYQTDNRRSVVFYTAWREEENY